MNNKFQAVRGTRDIFPPLVAEFVRLEQAARRQARLWGFEEIRTPVFEEAALFSRGVGETTDIVEKEMYVFNDAGGRTLALRPEGTAPVVRAYLENEFNRKEKICRLFYIANMFRAERPQAGRYREFEQIGFEIIGDASPAADAELITLVLAVFKDVGIKETRLAVNSIGCPDCRKPYRDAVQAALSLIEADLCDDCRRRLLKNPLRCLDCKKCSEKIVGKVPAFALCAACLAHEKAFLRLLETQAIKAANDPSIVRGLDYYTRTVFEISSPHLGSQNALCGGGRYDGLIELLGGTKTPATGFALGVDRTVQAMSAAAPGRNSVPDVAPLRGFNRPLALQRGALRSGAAEQPGQGGQKAAEDIFIVTIGQNEAVLAYAFEAAHCLRQAGPSRKIRRQIRPDHRRR
ncbi:MAG: histidine--tRNA ligase [Elusimicrobia bacterium]|nr:histidine--tRNA ligase [Elusimicrobiota bacterium]